MSPDRSSEDMSWAVKLANQGRDEAAIAKVLKTVPGRGRVPYSAKYLALLNDRGKAIADAYAERTARNAVEFIRANPIIRDRNEGILRVIQIREAADRMDWRADPSARRALEAAFLVALRISSVRFGLSVREHALTSGMSFQAVRTARYKLDGLGWLRRNRRDSPGRTSRFTLTHGSDPATHSNLSWSNTFNSHGLGDVNVLTPPPSRTFAGGAASLPADVNLNFAALAHDAFRDHDALWYESRRIPITREYLAALDEWASIRGTAGASAADRMLFERQRREFRDPHAVEVIRRVRVDEVREEADAAER